MLYEKIQLEPGEKVLKIVRKHWFVIVTELCTMAVVALFPLIILALYGVTQNELSASGINIPIDGTLVTFSIAAWVLLSLLSGFTIWTHYYLDLWVITDQRIISIDQVRFFSRNVAVFRLERLQDIQYSINGLLPTFLNFGTISAQTAGTQELNFYATNMADPRGLQATIQQAMDARLRTLRAVTGLSE